MTSNAAPEAREVWSIGDLRLDVGQQRLWRGSDEIVLPKLSFDLLLVLTRRAPDVVTYDELMDRVWPGLVVSPETIVQRVRLLRTAIGDDASDPRYVEALRSRGYRLVAAAARVNPTPTMAPAPPPQPGPEPGPDPLPAARAFPWAPALVALAVIALAGWLVARRTAAPDAPAQPSATTAQLEASARTLRTVAVLPFDNLSADPADAFIALAVSESMLDRLAALRGLTVIARDSAFRAGRETRMARETGALLGASWLVEGSVQRFGAGEAGVDLDTQRFGLFAEPAADVAERDDVVAFVMEAARQQAVGHPARTVFGKDEETVFADRRVERGTVLFPAGQQFGQCTRVHDGAGQDVGADFGAFLDQADGDFRVFFRRQLLQANRRCQAGRAAADDDDVELHCFAFHDVSS